MLEIVWLPNSLLRDSTLLALTLWDGSLIVTTPGRQKTYCAI